MPGRPGRNRDTKKSELAGTRTLDHRLKRAMLYRLSYQPTTNVKRFKIPRFCKNAREKPKKQGKNRARPGRFRRRKNGAKRAGNGRFPGQKRSPGRTRGSGIGNDCGDQFFAVLESALAGALAGVNSKTLTPPLARSSLIMASICSEMVLSIRKSRISSLTFSSSM